VCRNWHAHWTMNNLLQIQNLRSIPLSNIIQHVVEGSSKAIEKQRAHEMRGFGGGSEEMKMVVKVEVIMVVVVVVVGVVVGGGGV